MFPALSFEKNGKQRSDGASVSPTKLYSITSLHQDIVYTINFIFHMQLLVCEVFSSQQNSKILVKITCGTVLQFRTKRCNPRLLICLVYVNFLRSSRHFDFKTAFSLILSIPSERDHGFNNIRN